MRLRTKEELVSSLIRKAGELLPTPYANVGRFFRSLYSAGRVNVDLSAAMRNAGGCDNMTLPPGDSPDVAKYVPTVSVQGGPSGVTFVSAERTGT